eukprot:9438438-Lingulodinium_polyedra.AAC.1
MDPPPREGDGIRRRVFGASHRDCLAGGAPGMQGLGAEATRALRCPGAPAGAARLQSVASGADQGVPE